MLIKRSFEIPLYRGRFIVMFSDYNVQVSDHYDDLGENKTLEYASFILVNEKRKDGIYGSFLIGFNLKHKNRKITHGIISHEVLHAAHALLNDRGLKLTNESDEAYSYLIEWMTDLVYATIRKYNLEISDKG
jgi:hypothetical protein